MLIKIRKAIAEMITLGVLTEADKIPRTLDERATIELFNQKMEDITMKAMKLLPDDILVLIDEAMEYTPSREGDTVAIVGDEDEFEDEFSDAPNLEAPPLEKTIAIPPVASSKPVVDLPDLFADGHDNKEFEDYVATLTPASITLEVPRHIEYMNKTQKRDKPISIPPDEELDFADAASILMGSVEASSASGLPLHNFTIYLHNRFVALEVEVKNGENKTPTTEVAADKLTPQQKAAITRKKNAEAKRLKQEEEANRQIELDKQKELDNAEATNQLVAAKTKVKVNKAAAVEGILSDTGESVDNQVESVMADNHLDMVRSSFKSLLVLVDELPLAAQEEILVNCVAGIPTELLTFLDQNVYVTALSIYQNRTAVKGDVGKLNGVRVYESVDYGPIPSTWDGTGDPFAAGSVWQMVYETLRATPMTMAQITAMIHESFPGIHDSRPGILLVIELIRQKIKGTSKLMRAPSGEMSIVDESI